MLVRSILLFFLAFISQPVHRKTDPVENLFLLGSNYGGKRDENATALFNFIESQGYPAFYISNDPTGTNTIKRGSFNSYVRFFQTDTVFFTHSFSDILPYLHKAHVLINRFKLPRRVFIQHGVIGLKSQISENKTMSDYLASISTSFDKMVVSSEQEFQIVKRLGVPQKKLESPVSRALINCPSIIKNKAYSFLSPGASLSPTSAS